MSKSPSPEQHKSIYSASQSMSVTLFYLLGIYCAIKTRNNTIVNQTKLLVTEISLWSFWNLMFYLRLVRTRRNFISLANVKIVKILTSDS